LLGYRVEVFAPPHVRFSLIPERMRAGATPNFWIIKNRSLPQKSKSSSQSDSTPMSTGPCLRLVKTGQNS